MIFRETGKPDANPRRFIAALQGDEDYGAALAGIINVVKVGSLHPYDPSLRVANYRITRGRPNSCDIAVDYTPDPSAAVDGCLHSGDA